MVCPLTGDSTVEEEIDVRLLTAPQLIETGLLMPARLAKIGFGDKSQSLYEAVKLLTGLDQLSDIADGCGHFTHGARRFLRYGKEQGIDGHQARFDENLLKAEQKATLLKIELPKERALGDKNLTQNLQDAATSASVEAGNHLIVLKSEISPTIDTDKTEGRVKVKKAVDTARAIANQNTKGIPLFESWGALKDAGEDEKFKLLPAEIEATRLKLTKALSWHERQGVQLMSGRSMLSYQGNRAFDRDYLPFTEIILDKFPENRDDLLASCRSILTEIANAAGMEDAPEGDER
jgi:hypothetical protein